MSTPIKWSALSTRERDALVAEKVMGWTRHQDKMHSTDNRTIKGLLYCAPGFDGYNGGSAGNFNVVPNFSTCPKACSEVKAKLIQSGFRISIILTDNGASVIVTSESEEVSAHSKTEEESICLSALRACGVEVEA